MKNTKHFWPVLFIVIVLALTVYNILPTIFYYRNPLSKPVTEKEAKQVTQQIATRVNNLEKESNQWLRSFCKNLGIKKFVIESDPNDPQLISISFSQAKDAQLFKKLLPRAGALISFVPSQLSLVDAINPQNPNTVIVQRRLGIDLNETPYEELFTYSPKLTPNHEIAPFYKNWVYSRTTQITEALSGPSKKGEILSQILDRPSSQLIDRELLSLAKEIVSFENHFGDKSAFSKRFFASFSQVNVSNKQDLIAGFATKLEESKNLLTKEINNIKNIHNSLEKEGKYLDSTQRQTLQLYEEEKDILESALLIINRNKTAFASGAIPFTEASIQQQLGRSENSQSIASVKIGSNNPYVDSIELNWSKEIVAIHLHKDVLKLLNEQASSEIRAKQQEKLHQLVINEIAQVANETGEQIVPGEDVFSLNLQHLNNSNSILALDLSLLANNKIEKILSHLKSFWSADTIDFNNENYPILSYAKFSQLNPQDQKLGLVVFSPLAVSNSNQLHSKFRSNSIYVIAKGLKPLLEKYNQQPNSKEAELFHEDFLKLQNLLKQEGFQLAYPAVAYGLPSEYKNDFIFEYPDFYGDFLTATRENFVVKGNKQFAVLEFTDFEQRLLTLNRIESDIHEELLRWRDDYRAAQVDLDLNAKYDVPPPISNVYWSNLALSAKKYFRGDERKIIRWGLDLSGGKTLVIGLRDANNQLVTNKTDLVEGLNEITQRVNKLGLAEISPRIEGQHIVLDFPSSQNISGQDLIQASTMTFHVVNEMFTPNNPLLADAVNEFLQNVWNEAVVTNQKDPHSINAIAWKYLGGSPDGTSLQPTSGYAKKLYDNGLRLSPPNIQNLSEGSYSYNDTISSIAVYAGDDFTSWEGQTTPLLIVFKNSALEGKDLEDIRTGYDPSKGNVLSFSVKSAYTNKDGEKINPRENLYSWSSQYAHDKIVGTPKEKYSYHGGGWRMAVILNGNIVNTPALNSPLRDHVQVSGGFTQHEINKLAADLKAGSLSFNPEILSEENVSAELGQKERTQGIVATIVALALVIIVMLGYYRFAGLIAAVAVIFNLLIMWATLQNLQATLTLAGIAAIILTMGMAVDANVLVFERIREEYAISKRIASAVTTGYRKAFSAILDSNITTIIAALILLNFDAGPIKAFAITLTIGIISSMFTALYMTRTFFNHWVKSTKTKTLSMANFIKVKTFNFMKYGKPAVILSILVILVGGFFLFSQKNSILGMDFTGGYTLSVDFVENSSINYRERISTALQNNGAKKGDFLVRELNNPNSVRIQLSSAMDQKGQPFYNLPMTTEHVNISYKWENNPRLAWLISVLDQADLQIQASQLPHLDKSWSQMSGQLSKTMKNNAIYGLVLAFICILIYITFRFELKYATSAVVCVIHDVLFTLGLIAILHVCGLYIQINLQVVAALMTIIGYSLNDTIIVFDRIREEFKLMRKASFLEVINHSLRITLNRTLMTSFTTLIVLIALVVLGGSQIFDFSLVMALGVIFGTLSSLFIAPVMLHYLHNKENSKENKKAIMAK